MQEVGEIAAKAARQAIKEQIEWEKIYELVRLHTDYLIFQPYQRKYHLRNQIHEHLR